MHEYTSIDDEPLPCRKYISDVPTRKHDLRASRTFQQFPSTKRHESSFIPRKKLLLKSTICYC